MTRGIEQRRIVDDAKEKVGIEELKGGSHRAQMPGIGSELAVRLIEECGLSLAEIERQLGVTTSAVSKAIRKREGGDSTYPTTTPSPVFPIGKRKGKRERQRRE